MFGLFVFVGSFSGLSNLYCPSVFSNAYLSKIGSSTLHLFFNILSFPAIQLFPLFYYKNYIIGVSFNLYLALKIICNILYWKKVHVHIYCFLYNKRWILNNGPQSQFLYLFPLSIFLVVLLVVQKQKRSVQILARCDDLCFSHIQNFLKLSLWLFSILSFQFRGIICKIYIYYKKTVIYV